MARKREDYDEATERLWDKFVVKKILDKDFEKFKNKTEMRKALADAVWKTTPEKTSETLLDWMEDYAFREKMPFLHFADFWGESRRFRLMQSLREGELKESINKELKRRRGLEKKWVKTARVRTEKQFKKYAEVYGKRLSEKEKRERETRITKLRKTQKKVKAGIRVFKPKRERVPLKKYIYGKPKARGGRKPGEGGAAYKKEMVTQLKGARAAKLKDAMRQTQRLEKAKLTREMRLGQPAGKKIISAEQFAKRQQQQPRLVTRPTTTTKLLQQLRQMELRRGRKQLSVYKR